MEYRFREEVKCAKKAVMGEMFRLAGENLKDGQKIINFASGHPATDVFSTEIIAEYVNKALVEGGKELLQYGPHIGYKPLRDEFKKFANSKEKVLKEQDDIMITYGSSEAISLVASALINRNDVVIVDEPSFVNAIKSFRLAGAKVLSAKTESDGVNLNELEEKFKCGAKLYYIIPDFNNPSGITTSYEKRKAIIELAEKYNVLILEDNIYSLLRYRGNHVPSIKSLDKHGNVVHICSVSKIICPAVRLGYIIAEKELINKLVVIKAVSSNGVTTILQSAVAKMFNENDMNLEIGKVCDVYSKKLTTMENCMERFFPSNVSFSRPDGGMYIWVTLPQGSDVEAICKKIAKERHIPITPGTGFCVENADKCTSMRFNFVKESIYDIEYGIRSVGEALSNILK